MNGILAHFTPILFEPVCPILSIASFIICVCRRRSLDGVGGVYVQNMDAAFVHVLLFLSFIASPCYPRSRFNSVGLLTCFF